MPKLGSLVQSLAHIHIRRNVTVKKIMIAMLAFSFLAGTTVFAQDATTNQTAPKKEKKHKKSKKDKSATEAPKAQ
jgi:Ni/Co efflux regulator RcnB